MGKARPTCFFVRSVFRLFCRVSFFVCSVFSFPLLSVSTFVQGFELFGSLESTRGNAMSRMSRVSNDLATGDTRKPAKIISEFVHF